MNLIEKDYYLTQQPKQPKKEIADYVESQGILVPPRFESLNEALRSGKPFIVRSEHPQDYDGVSNLLASKTVQCPQSLCFEERDQGRLEESLTKERMSAVKYYYEYMGWPAEDIAKDISYSYWQLINGINHTIIADSAVVGRYYVFSSEYRKGVSKRPVHNNSCMIIDNGKVMFNRSSLATYLQRTDLAMDLTDSFSQLIEFYEAVRNQSRFNPNHCPIIEAQQDHNGNIYFLQYHRTKNFQQATFALDRPPEEDERRALLVRGCTPPEGVVYQYPIPKKPDTFTLVDEILLKSQQIHILFENPLTALVCEPRSHLYRSRIFKPELSVFMKYHRNFCNLPDVINLRAISDGMTAYLKLEEGWDPHEDNYLPLEALCSWL